MFDRSYNLLVVCGPTASGKTALAVVLARQLDGEIIGADSRQVYRGLDIGSGKDLDEYSAGTDAVPYHLIDIADPENIYTLYHFQQDFYRILKEVNGRRHLPVLCGGSGLYIEAVLRGYRIPSIPENRPLRLQLMTLQHADLEAMLHDLDENIYLQTDLSSKKRIVRAIEVAMYSKDCPVPGAVTHVPSITPLVLCTRWDRAALHERIDRRLDARFTQGMVDEVRRLRRSGLSDERLFMLGMEYRHITRYLRNEVGYPDMVVNLRRAIRQLAKRQETYFRGMERRGSAIHWIDGADAEAALAIVRRCLNRR